MKIQFILHQSILINTNNRFWTNNFRCKPPRSTFNISFWTFFNQFRKSKVSHVYTARCRGMIRCQSYLDQPFSMQQTTTKKLSPSFPSFHHCKWWRHFLRLPHLDSSIKFTVTFVLLEKSFHFVLFGKFFRFMYILNRCYMHSQRLT